MSKLVLLPSPIGNLSDLTKRAIEEIENSDLIFCEDTRHTVKLLNHLEIKKTLKSYHKFNEHKIVESIINKLKITSFKKNVIQECKELFHDSKFEEKLDSNINLYGISNC